MHTESVTLERLFPGLTPEERKEAEETLRRYVRVVVRIHESLRADPERYARWKTLTEELRCRTMGEDQSNIINPNRTSEA